MKKLMIIALISIISFSMLFSGCGKTEDPGNGNNETPGTSLNEQTQPSSSETPKPTEPAKTAEPVDFSKVKPNESGQIMVVMFHNFIETYKAGGDKEYTTTFDDFRALLKELYDKGYRLINMNDYINNNINVPAGCVPMVFTFDDGTPGQFNLVEEDGKLAANKNSAVAIMEEFNKQYPDFGLKGTFYVNLGGGTFEGKGTLEERLKYLTERGFEIGNHTYNHFNLSTAKTAEKVQFEVGSNQKEIEKLIPGYKMTSLALPLGITTGKDLKGYIAKGSLDGTEYENKAIMLVGANPAPSPVSKNFKLLATPRVRSTGIEKVDADLAWWLKNISRSSEYVSDGNPDTITVPKAKEGNVDASKVGNKTVQTY